VHPLGLAEVVVLAEVEAVVRGEEDERVLPQPQRVELREKAPDPEVHHRDLAAICSVREVHVVLREPGFLVLPVAGI
jgi:hypothetical protein